MNEFKETNLVVFSTTLNDLRMVQFETLYDAERVATFLSKILPPGEITLLQVRVRYYKIEEDDE